MRFFPGEDQRAGEGWKDVRFAELGEYLCEVRESNNLTRIPEYRSKCLKEKVGAASSVGNRWICMFSIQKREAILETM